MPAKKHAIAFIAITLLLDTIGFGLIIPVLPALLTHITGDPLSRAAIDGGWLAFIYASMQFVCAPILGNLSDRFGRRPVLLYAIGALGVDYIIMGSAPTLGWLFVGRADLRHGRRFLHAGLCLRRGHQPSGKAGPEFRGGERHVRPRIHHRPRSGRIPRFAGSSGPVLRRGSNEPAQSLLWHFRVARIAAGRPAPTLRMETRQSAWRVSADAQAPRSHRDCSSRSFSGWWRTRSSHLPGASTASSASAGPKR